MKHNSLSQTQAQTQTQTQTLSPRQVLFVRMLELTTVELEDKVRSELLENPALEAIEPDTPDASNILSGEESTDEISSADDYRTPDDVPEYAGWEHRSTAGTAEEIPLSAGVSFGDTLLEQLGELRLDETEKAIGEYLIGSLEEDGLLYKPLDEIIDELTIYNGIYTDEKTILRLLQMIQTFDPPGIGARSLQECLLLQIKRQEENATGRNESLALQRSILTRHYDEFSQKRWENIAAKLGCDESSFREAIAEITRLNPRPGASLTEGLGTSRQQIVPDFTVEVQDETISVQLDNMYIPRLCVSDEYQQMLETQLRSDRPEEKAAAQFLRHKIDAAKGFISAVKQREETLTRTMNEIVKAQREFLLSGGDEALLKPMILEDIARATGYDISTVSRVSNSKYVQLPWGIFPLKYFFNDGVATVGGGEISVRELHRCLQELIATEDKSNPLTDAQLTDELCRQGFSLARRTVAKYREQLNIPVARLRKG
ncbi:MAG: RNA polymerase factor sigma-54 [Bacteroidaceae bacterium]|nr:RNA polymerase factor sigma-54 [Bacteroidaceae bacterium]